MVRNIILDFVLLFAPCAISAVAVNRVSIERTGAMQFEQTKQTGEAELVALDDDMKKTFADLQDTVDDFNLGQEDGTEHKTHAGTRRDRAAWNYHSGVNATEVCSGYYCRQPLWVKKVMNNKCNESTWPDVAKVCDDCKVKVEAAYYCEGKTCQTYNSCDDYCENSVAVPGSMVCAGAWKPAVEEHGTCRMKEYGSCSDSFEGWDGMICKCVPQAAKCGNRNADTVPTSPSLHQTLRYQCRSDGLGDKAYVTGSDDLPAREDNCCKSTCSVTLDDTHTYGYGKHEFGNKSPYKNGATVQKVKLSGINCKARVAPYASSGTFDSCGEPFQSMTEGEYTWEQLLAMGSVGTGQMYCIDVWWEAKANDDFCCEDMYAGNTCKYSDDDSGLASLGLTHPRDPGSVYTTCALVADTAGSKTSGGLRWVNICGRPTDQLDGSYQEYAAQYCCNACEHSSMNMAIGASDSGINEWATFNMPTMMRTYKTDSAGNYVEACDSLAARGCFHGVDSWGTKSSPTAHMVASTDCTQPAIEYIGAVIGGPYTVCAGVAPDVGASCVAKETCRNHCVADSNCHYYTVKYEFSGESAYIWQQYDLFGTWTQKRSGRFANDRTPTKTCTLHGDGAVEHTTSIDPTIATDAQEYISYAGPRSCPTVSASYRAEFSAKCFDDAPAKLNVRIKAPCNSNCENAPTGLVNGKLEVYIGSVGKDEGLDYALFTVNQCTGGYGYRPDLCKARWYPDGYSGTQYAKPSCGSCGNFAGSFWTPGSKSKNKYSFDGIDLQAPAGQGSLTRTVRFVFEPNDSGHQLLESSSSPSPPAPASADLQVTIFGASLQSLDCMAREECLEVFGGSNVSHALYGLRSDAAYRYECLNQTQTSPLTASTVFCDTEYNDACDAYAECLENISITHIYLLSGLLGAIYDDSAPSAHLCSSSSSSSLMEGSTRVNKSLTTARSDKSSSGSCFDPFTDADPDAYLCSCVDDFLAVCPLATPACVKENITDSLRDELCSHSDVCDAWKCNQCTITPACCPGSCSSSSLMEERLDQKNVGVSGNELQAMENKYQEALDSLLEADGVHELEGRATRSSEDTILRSNIDKAAQDKCIF